MICDWASPLEKFPRYGGENSKSSDFAATIINQFAGADTQNAFTSGSIRPVTDTRHCRTGATARFKSFYLI
jgi:hypothetical protein